MEVRIYIGLTKILYNHLINKLTTLKEKEMKTVKSYSIVLLAILIFLHGCKIKTDEDRMELLKKEVTKTEQNFAELVKKEGVKKAFLQFASDDAVLNRDNTIIKGKDAIKAYFESQILQNVTLDWKPDFVDVSLAGDLSYTYGKYSFSGTDQNGEKITSEGNFHTVWKRQKDGSWKYVWD